MKNETIETEMKKKLGKYDIKIETMENERKKNIERTRGRKKG